MKSEGKNSLQGVLKQTRMDSDGVTSRILDTRSINQESSVG
jgi:hypothetical protein